MLDRDQLKAEIASQSVDKDCRLILKPDGQFEIISYDSPSDVESFEDIEYVTRWETFDQGKGYIGEEASKDDAFIDNIMRWAEEAWSEYQKTGKTKIININS